MRDVESNRIHVENLLFYRFGEFWQRLCVFIVF